MVKHQSGEGERGGRDILGLYKNFVMKQLLGNPLTAHSDLSLSKPFPHFLEVLPSFNCDIESIHFPYFNFPLELHGIV